jgi:hypothetical protein
MGANIAGIYGAQIFRADDRPLYRRGFGINIGVLTAGLTLAVIRYIDERIRRRRKVNALQTESESDHVGHVSDEKIPALPRPSDVQPAPILIGDGLKPVISNAQNPPKQGF